MRAQHHDFAFFVSARNFRDGVVLGGGVGEGVLDVEFQLYFFFLFEQPRDPGPLFAGHDEHRHADGLIGLVGTAVDKDRPAAEVAPAMFDDRDGLLVRKEFAELPLQPATALEFADALLVALAGNGILINLSQCLLVIPLR